MSTRIKAVLLVVAVLSLSLFFAPTSHAALSALGPVDPENGFPAWYQDATGLSLAPCFDNNGFCSSTMVAGPAFDPALPIVFPTNFPEKGFYFYATATSQPDGTLYLAALEFALLPAGPTVPPQTTFARIRFDNNGANVVAGTYTMTHPFGVDTVEVTPDNVAKNQGLRFTEDILPVNGVFTGALQGRIGPFLRKATGLATSPDGNIYVGDSIALTTVTGAVAPGVNSFTVVGPISGTTNLFTLEGKVIAMSVTPSTIAFPAQRPLVDAAPVTVTVTNLNVVNNLAFASILSQGTNSADFRVVDVNCLTGSPIGPSGSCSFNVIFNGAAAGSATRTATVAVTATTPASTPPALVNLTGTIDAVPPTVTATFPANNAVNVPSNSAITATFSENVMNLNAITFTLTTGGAPVTGTVSFYAPSRTATFSPSANLISNATYTATITTGVTDLAGNALAQDFVLTFRTTLPNITPPAVIATIPGTNAVDVPINQAISATFNEPVDPASVNATTFFLSGGVTGTVSFDPVTRTATLTPHVPLTNKQLYTATLTTGIFSLGNIPMAADYVWSFLVSSPLAISITNPGAVATTVYGNSFAIHWTATVPAGAAGITLGYDATGASACNGTQITSRITSTSGPDAFTWDMTTLSEGTYYIYANINDGASAVCSYAATPLVKSNATGDITGDGIVNIADALKVLHMAVGLLSPSASETSFCDVAPLANGKPQPDGKIDLGDVVVILRRAVGLASW